MTTVLSILAWIFFVAAIVAFIWLQALTRARVVKTDAQAQTSYLAIACLLLMALFLKGW